ncbi:MAG TPA: hypothetical protein VKS20_02390 [Candidatus Acidoferrales bacterium]|nr:hypothetical protein [Candidatus Acidoferrales bacterium]
MATKIMSGFPLRRCSWYYTPIVPILSTCRMMRWLDAVCLKQVTFNMSLMTHGTTKERGVDSGT